MALFSIHPFTAWANPAQPPEASCKFLNCKVTASHPPRDSDTQEPGAGKGRGGSTSAARAEEAALKKYNAEFKAYEAAYTRHVACQRAAFVGNGAVSSCGGVPSPPDLIMTGIAVLDGTAPPLITPGQAGAIAAARLKIPTIAPGIGPSPDLNRWKMAAVGYPLWLWADGPTQVGPVSDSVAGLSVSLQAEATSLTFRMGDGTTVTCQGVGDKWTKAVEPGTEAPSCGHTYTKPSLPRGNYKVTALTEWAVTWTANGQSGVINVPAVQTAELPVGELQVLVR